MGCNFENIKTFVCALVHKTKQRINLSNDESHCTSLSCYTLSASFQKHYANYDLAPYVRDCGFAVGFTKTERNAFVCDR